MIGDSTDEDSNDDDEGVAHGVEMPFAPERRAVEVDAPSAAEGTASRYNHPKAGIGLVGCSRGTEAGEGSRVRASCASAS